MSQIAVPSSVLTSRRLPIRLILAILAILIAAGAWTLFRSGSSASAGTVPENSLFYAVTPMDLDFVVSKSGELQAVSNIEIVSLVEGSTTIQTLVGEGTGVKKGDVLMTLDSSAIKQKIEDTTLDLQKAEADLTTSREMRAIQESQNAANLEAAEVAVKLAQLDLEDYTNGAYPQQLANAQTDLESAKITLKNRQEDLAQTKSLAEKGFVTASDVKKAEVELTNAQNAVDKADTALKRLSQYTHQMDSASKENALSQAEQKLARTKRENASNMMQKNADVAAKEQNHSLLQRRMERLQEQLDACTIKAPADGMVVYATSGDRNAQTLIQEGAQVRERQTLLRLPETNNMKVVIKVSESQVGNLKLGQRAKVLIRNVAGSVTATVTKIAVMADSGGRWFNPDTKDFPVELVLDYTPPELRPGVGAETTIFVGRAERALAAKLTTVYTEGETSYVFRRIGDENRVQPVKIKLGKINYQYGVVEEGIKEGDQLLELQIGQAREILTQFGVRSTAKSEAPDAKPRGDGQPGGNRGGNPGGNGGGEGRRRGNGQGAAGAPEGDAPRNRAPQG